MATDLNVKSAKGSEFGYKISGSTYTYLQVFNDLDISGDETTINELGYLSQIYVDKVAGEINSGTATFTVPLVFESEDVVALRGIASSRTTIAWRLRSNNGTTATSGSTLDFAACIQSIKDGPFGNDVPRLSVTLAITGAKVYTPGT